MACRMPTFVEGHMSSFFWSSRFSLQRSLLCALWIVPAILAPLSFPQTSAAPSNSDGAAKRFVPAANVAPSFSWASGTQNQTIYGGSALISATKSASFCDPGMQQFGLAASASDTKTAKSALAGGGTPSYIFNNDVKLDAMTGLDKRKKPSGGSGPWTSHFVAADADFFENTSLGIGLQKTFAAQYQYDLGCKLNRANPDAAKRFFASLGIGLGYMNQRLYKTVPTVNGAVLPLSAQLTYLIGGEKKETHNNEEKPKGDEKRAAPKLIWSMALGYVPVLNDNRAYQLSGIMSVQIPTQIRWLAITLADTDLYARNAPVGHKRNYNNGTISLVFSVPSKNPKKPPKETGACYGSDKLQRIYCYEGVPVEACTGTNIFIEKGHCSAAGNVPAID